MNSRRQFLKGAGGASLAIPFLQSLAPINSFAQALSPAKRFVTFYTGNGVDLVDWFPEMQTSATLSPLGVKETNLSDIITAQGRFSNCISSKWNPIMNQVSFLRGIDIVYSGGHCNNRALTGYNEVGNGILPNNQDVSLDQFMMASSSFYNYQPVMGGIHFGVGGSSSVSYVMQNGRAQQQLAFSKPSVAYESIFRAVGTSPTAANYRTQSKSVLDAVLGDFLRVSKGTKISQSDRAILESHMERIRSIEKSLERRAAITCSLPAAPGTISQTDLSAFYKASFDAYYGIIASAFQCGITSIATIAVNRGIVLPFLPGVSSDHHGYSHNFNPKGPLMEITKYLGERFVDLIEALKVPDPSGAGTLFDNTLVYWSNDTGQAHFHSSSDVPVVFASGSDRFVRRGKLLDYRTDKNWSNGLYKIGRPQNQVLVSIAQAFGMVPAEYERAGKLGFGDYGNLVDGSNQWGDLGKRTALPGLLKTG